MSGWFLVLALARCSSLRSRSESAGCRPRERCASRCRSASRRPSCRSSASCAGRSSSPATRSDAASAERGRRRFGPRLLHHRERRPRHRHRRDARLPAHRDVDRARRRRARARVRRPLVPGARSGVGGARRLGVFSPLGLDGVDTANFFGYVLWSVWLIAFGVVILVHERRRASAAHAVAVTS